MTTDVAGAGLRRTRSGLHFLCGGFAAIGGIAVFGLIDNIFGWDARKTVVLVAVAAILGVGSIGFGLARMASVSGGPLPRWLGYFSLFGVVSACSSFLLMDLLDEAVAPWVFLFGFLWIPRVVLVAIAAAGGVFCLRRGFVSAAVPWFLSLALFFATWGPQSVAFVATAVFPTAMAGGAFLTAKALDAMEARSP